jgi:hypothetical protein
MVSRGGPEMPLDREVRSDCRKQPESVARHPKHIPARLGDSAALTEKLCRVGAITGRVAQWARERVPRENVNSR